jgi:hypothetical protein
MSRFAHLRKSSMYFVKIDQLRYPDMSAAIQTCYEINADQHTFLKQLLLLFLRVISFKGLLSQWAGVFMCLPSQFCQISIDSDLAN